MKGLVKIAGSYFLLSCSILLGGCGPDIAERTLENGAVLEERGQSLEAMAEYNRAIELDPKMVNAYYNRALLYQSQGNVAAALADFDKIIAINPNYGEPYYGRGQIYDGQGKKDKAIEEYTKAIENKLHYGMAYYRRSLAYDSVGEYRKAWDDVQKAKSLGVIISEDFFKKIQAEVSKQK